MNRNIHGGKTAVGSVSKKKFQSPYVFVVGCPRSGTTLLQRMLDAHPQMAIANDTHFITRAAKKVLRNDPGPALTAELVEQVYSYRRFYRMGLDHQEVVAAADDCGTYSEFVSRLYDRRAMRQNKLISGEKTPDYCRQIPALHRLFPHSKFIHIIRDGRDTALSTLDWATEIKGPGKWSLWASDPVGTCALWWQWQVSHGYTDGARLGPGLYHELRYEDLVVNPAGELNRISDFLGIPYSEKMSHFFRGKTKTQKGLSAKAAWIPPTSGLRDWRSQMSREDTAVFCGIAGSWLARIGYDCEKYPESQAIKRRIESCLSWWGNQSKIKGVCDKERRQSV